MGQVLVAIPNTDHTEYNRGIMLVTSHWSAGSSMIMINKPAVNNIPVTAVLRNAGIAAYNNDPVFYGGPDEPHRVQFIHTLDWAVPNTRQINDELGITSETSILAAIATDEGPEKWRCVMGQRVVSSGGLEGEMSGAHPWKPGHRWLTVPATADLIFKGTLDEQWLHAIDVAGKQEVANWF
jgi:putative transcriptional regulator